MQEVVRPGCSVLDVGCGSGILAISSLLCGAGSAVLCDIDETAVKVARENAALNGVAERCTVVQGDLATGVQGRFDVIFANIVADIVIRLLPDVKPHLNEGGVLVASGIVDVRRDEVLAAMEQAGLTVLDVREEKGWYAITCRA